MKRTGEGLGGAGTWDGAEARTVREQLGWSQVTMAYEMGCSPRTVWAWENAGRAFHFQGKLHREKLDLLAEVVKDRDPARRS